MSMNKTVKFIIDDDFDYGIEHEDQSILFTDNTQFQADDIVNPFFVGIKGGNVLSQEKSKIYNGYKHVIVLCLANNNIDNIISDKFYDYKIKKSDLEEIKNINYFKTSINILKNSDHYFKANIVKKEYLQELFPQGEFLDNEIVIPFLELNEYNAKLYCDSYKQSVNIDDLELELSLTNHFIDNEYANSVVEKALVSTINNISGLDHWGNKNNCNINLTTTFIDREFNNRRNTGIQLVSIAKNKENTFTKEHHKVSTNYTPDQEQLKATNTEFIDPALVIRQPKNGTKRSFFINSTELYSNKQIMTIYNLLKTEKEKYFLLNNLLASKDLCHLLVNNQELLLASKSIIDKYLHVFKYTWGYAWLTLYLEESLKRNNAIKNDRFVFDINTANKLPSFPFNLTDLKQNPYITVLIDDIELNPTNNCLGFAFQDNYDGYGVVDLETFKRRFNLFTTGDHTIGIFDGLKWDKFAISGSIMPACLQKRNPLLDYFVKNSNGNENDGFRNYINKYYGTSDIDLMCNDSSTIEFIKSVQNVYEIFKTNTKSKDDDIKIESIKSVAVMITKYFFKDCLEDFNKKFNLNKNDKEFEEMIDDFRFKIYVYSKYTHYKEQQSFKLLSEAQLDPHNKFCKEYLMPFSNDTLSIFKVDDTFYGEEYKKKDVDIILYRNDFSDNKFEKGDNHCVIKIAESVRYKITTSRINKTFEIFKIRDKDFFNTVANFHFPCVRAYYQGTNVYILPSCITAMQTGLNIEYKYFAGIRNPLEIINKYIQRGFGVILNKFEIKLWTDSYKIPENVDGDLSIVGIKTLKNHMFSLDQTKLSDVKTFINNDDIRNYYKKYSKNSCVDFTKMTTINKSGDINKFNHGFIQLCYDELN